MVTYKCTTCHETTILSIYRDPDALICPMCQHNGVELVTQFDKSKFPTVDEFDPFIVRMMDELLAVLRERGQQYGEEVLFDNGERGILAQVDTKLGRIKGGLASSNTFADRFDSWLDLAGYSVLVCAMADWGGYLDPTRYRPSTDKT